MLIVSLYLIFNRSSRPACLEFACKKRREVLRAPTEHDAVDVHNTVTELDCEVGESWVVKIRVYQVTVAGHGGCWRRHCYARLVVAPARRCEGGCLWGVKKGVLFASVKAASS